MAYYKSPNNKVHFIDDEKNESLLPKGSVRITKEEADLLIPESPYHTPKEDGSGCEITPENQLLKDAEESEQQRLDEIKVAQEASGFKKKSVGWAHNKIDQIFSGATTVALLRTACIQAFKILATLILK